MATMAPLPVMDVGTGESHGDGAQLIRGLLAKRMSELSRHRYFEVCRSRHIAKIQMLKVVEQLYCFSVFYERLLTRRLSRFDSSADPTLVALARQHLHEEIGHIELFRRCLRVNGMSDEQIYAIHPKTFSRAIFGYLLTTIDYENAYVANIAIIQVMETIANHFFAATLDAIKALDLSPDAFSVHVDADEGHAELGLASCANLAPATLVATERIIDDLFTLMRHVFDEWLDT